MRVSVLIPSFKRPLDLERCLAALAMQTRPADEVLVIAREADRETVNLIYQARQNLKTLSVVYVSQAGVIAALNCGFEHAMGDIVVLTDDDSEPEIDWLERLETSFSDSSIGAAGGRDWLQLPEEPGKFRPRAVSQVGTLRWFGKQYGNHHCPLIGHSKTVMFLKGVNMALRRRALAGYRIDTRLRGQGTQVGWEVDLCMQIRRAGFLILFDDRILVKHYCAPRLSGDGREDSSGRLFEDMSFNNHYLVAKHFGLFGALPYLLHDLLLGSRHMPGLLASIKWSTKGDKGVWQRVRVMTKSKLDGFRFGRYARNTALRRRADLPSAQTIA